MLLGVTYVFGVDLSLRMSMWVGTMHATSYSTIACVTQQDAVVFHVAYVAHINAFPPFRGGRGEVNSVVFFLFVCCLGWRVMGRFRFLSYSGRHRLVHLAIFLDFVSSREGITE